MESRDIQGIDLDIMKQMQEGDERAFEIFYESCHMTVFRIAYSYFRNEDKAWDIVQDVFLSVFRNIGKLRELESWRSWLIKISYNCCHKEYSKNKKHMKNSSLEDIDNWEDVLTRQTPSESHDSIMEQKEAVEIVLKEIDDMKPEMRMVGYLFFFEQQDYNEISSVMTISKGTVASRINRIKGRLQKTLTVNGYGQKVSAILAVASLRKIYELYMSTAAPTKNLVFGTDVMAKASVAAQGAATAEVGIGSVLTKIAVGALVAIPTVAIIGTGGVTKIFSNAKTERVKVTEVSTDMDEATESANATEDINITTDKTTDNKAPDVTRTDQGDNVIIQIHDDSAINYDRLKVYVNGKGSSDYTLDQSANQITIKKDINNKVKIKVEDVAGNVSDVSVDFIEVKTTATGE